VSPGGLGYGRRVPELPSARGPISAFVVVPIFALANAGVRLDGGALREAFAGRVAWAIVIGLLVGKTVGITAATWLLVTRGWSTLPGDMRGREVLPIAALGGIGFTVALFIADLAFTDPVLVEEAKIGILAATVLASMLGAALLARAVRGRK